MSSGATVAFNDPRRFGCMKLVPAPADRRGAAASCARPRAAGQRVRARDAGKGLRRQADQREGGAARPAGRGGTWQYLCMRGAQPRADFAAAPGLHAGGRSRPAARARRAAGRRRSGRCSTTRSPPAAPRCAITSAPTARLAISSTISGSMIARERDARRAAAGHHPAHRADRPLDVLLPGVPEVASGHSRAQAGGESPARMMPM